MAAPYFARHAREAAKLALARKPFEVPFSYLKPLTSATPSEEVIKRVLNPPLLAQANIPAFKPDITADDKAKMVADTLAKFNKFTGSSLTELPNESEVQARFARLNAIIAPAQNNAGVKARECLDLMGYGDSDAAYAPGARQAACEEEDGDDDADEEEAVDAALTDAIDFDRYPELPGGLRAAMEAAYAREMPFDPVAVMRAAMDEQVDLAKAQMEPVLRLVEEEYAAPWRALEAERDALRERAMREDSEFFATTPLEELRKLYPEVGELLKKALAEEDWAPNKIPSM